VTPRFAVTVRVGDVEVRADDLGPHDAVTVRAFARALFRSDDGARLTVAAGGARVVERCAAGRWRRVTR